MRALGKGTYTRIMRAYDKHASARILLKNECASMARARAARISQKAYMEGGVTVMYDRTG